MALADSEGRPGAEANVRRGGRARPVVWRLIALCAAVTLPLFGFVALVLTQYAQASRSQLERAGVEAARDIADVLDRDMTSLTAILQTLSYSSRFSAKDFGSFYQTAERVARTTGIPVVLSDSSGQQIVNTRLPFGAPLPRLAVPFEDVLRTGKPVVFDLFTGSVAQTPLYGLAAPVFDPDTGAPVYVLNFSISPDRILGIVRSIGLTDGAFAGVIDRNGVMIARTIDHESNLGSRPSIFLAAVGGRREGQARIVNRYGQEILASFTTMKSTGWIVAHGLPVDVIDEPIRLLLRQLLLLGLLTALAGGVGGFVLSRRLTLSLSALEDSATAVGRGEIVEPIHTAVTEINKVGSRLAYASRELKLATEAKDALLYEVNHRVKNSLAIVTSLLGMQAKQTKDAGLKRGLEVLGARIDVIANVHQRLYGSGMHDRLDLGPFLADVATNMAQALCPSSCELQTYCESGIVLGVDRTTPLALIVGELLTNAIKHGRVGEGTCRISLSVRSLGEGRVSVVVADEGPGLPEGFDGSPKSGVGMRIISGLVRQIRGRLETNAGETGARFEIILDEGQAWRARQ